MQDLRDLRVAIGKLERTMVERERERERLAKALLDLLDAVHEGRLVPDNAHSEGYVNSLVSAGEGVLLSETDPENYSAWRPISQAPRDGTQIIAYRPSKPTPHIEGMYWVPYPDSNAEGAWHWSFDGDCPSVNDQQPTHWMPVPEMRHG